MQKSGHVDDVHISALDVFHEKNGRRVRYIGEVLELHRGEVNSMNSIGHVSTLPGKTFKVSDDGWEKLENLEK